MVEPASERRNLFVFLILSSVLLVVAGAGIAIYYGKSYTNVKQIRVTGNSYLTSAEVLQASGLKSDAPMTRGDLFTARNKLLEIPAIQSVVMQDENGEIVIRVHERLCSAVLRLDGSMIDVDESGRILHYDGRCTASPIVSGAFRIQGNNASGEGLSETLLSLRSIREQTPDLEKRISEILVRKGYYTLFMIRPPIQMDVPDLTAATVERITVSLAYFEKEGRQKGRIDLRGKNALYQPQS